MARVQFGNTWWGKKWVEALDNIDFANRLPRGATYARNGSVRSINIDGNRVSAKVKGSRPMPYSVSLSIPPFGSSERAAIHAVIAGSAYYLSQLEAHLLPTELHEELGRAGIKLFPGSWEEMGMECSCPDWAVPCKHLAAVTYLIGNEIDKNPFLVFGLHGYDLLADLDVARSAEEEAIVSMRSLVAPKPRAYTYYQEKLEHIDFSRVPTLLSAVDKLLTERPLFYLADDFKKLLIEVYKRTAKGVRKRLRDVELFEDVTENLYSTAELRISPRGGAITGKLATKGNTLTFATHALDQLADLLQTLTIGDLNRYPPVLSFLTVLHSYAVRLIERSAFVPEIISLDARTFVVRWIPALFDRDLASITDALVDALPKALVTFGGDPLQPREQVLFLISLFIGHYLERFGNGTASARAHDNAAAQAGRILSLFFRSEPYVPTRFEERENAKTINLWLNRFFLHPKFCFPVIKIDEREAENEFSFDLAIRDKRDDNVQPAPLAEFLGRADEERLPVLRDLSLLSTYLPVVNRVLKEVRPVTVNGEELVSFWFEALPVLRTLGISTLLPKSLREVFVPQLTLSLAAKTGAGSEAVRSYLDLDGLLEFSWSIAIGDRLLTPREFKELAREYRGIVRFHDSYVYIDERDLARLEKQIEREPSVGPLDALGIMLEEAYEGAPVRVEESLRRAFRKLIDPEPISLPSGLAATLRPYQEAGYQWLCHNFRAGFGSLIADDMGLGKTVQVIGFLLRLKEEGLLDGERQALVVVPASLMTNWQREVERFAPSLTALVYHGSEREEPVGADLIITTYALAARDHQHLAKRPWRCVVCDEAQNIKNPATKWTKAVKSLRADHKIAMTGTPVENRLLDYWSVLDFAMPRLLGTRTSFKERFAVPIEKFKERDRLDSFRRITAPFILRRLKTDKSIIDDLPEKVELDRYAELSPEQAALYEGLVKRVDELRENLSPIERRGLIFKLISGLKQICDHPALYLKQRPGSPDRSGKMALFFELVDSILERGEKVIVFSQFKQMGDLLAATIEERLGFAPLFLHGGLVRQARDEVIDSFQNEPRHRVMLLSLKAGGTGLNLTAANNVLHFDLWWNPAVERQATDRAFRIGQKRHVTVFRFITRGTFEEKINEMLLEKRDLADLTVSHGEKWIGELSNRELKELLSLERR